MLTYRLIWFSILCTCYIANICEAGPDDLWTLEQEETFSGTICDRNSDFLEQLCHRYAIWQDFKFVWEAKHLKQLSCQGLSTKLWSEKEKRDEKVLRLILECNFYEESIDLYGEHKYRIYLSRGKNQKDVAEYAHDLPSDSLIPYQMLEDMLDKLI